MSKATSTIRLSPLDLVAQNHLPTLHHRLSTPTRRPVSYLEWQDGLLTLPDGRTVAIDPFGGAAALLAALVRELSDTAQTVYLVTGMHADTAPTFAWYLNAATERWQIAPVWGSCDKRNVTYARDKRRIDLRHTAAWWGECRDVPRIRSAYKLLEQRLQRDFGAKGEARVILWPTPAATGLQLLDLALPGDHRTGLVVTPYEFPVLSDGLLRFFGDSSDGGVSFQHRREYTVAPGITEIPRLVVRDGRIAYAAHLRPVPTGIPTLDDLPDYEPFRPGWYHVTVRVPDDWRHVGLVRPIDRSEWPSEPGARFETWLAEPEMRLISHPGHHGFLWRYQIHERLLFQRPNAPGADPLHSWADKLHAAYYKAVEYPDTEIGVLLSGALRAIMLSTIGSFKRSEAEETRYIPPGQPIDPRWRPEFDANVGAYLCHVPVEIPRDRLRYLQPHWLAHIWSSQRAALVRTAVQQHKRDEVLGFRVDGFAVSSPPVGHDRGKIGEYRIKGLLSGPLAAPRNRDELERLMHLAEGGK